ncbi:hypothetical protein MML48_7g00003128 [Holotrichia oblita]|uniref:Uncharacterized protein n=1 Tax=Holotrichia oblita TaxID=644536 RepID=A0ACB9SS84_HOLOL|nr:hypothetical protein MML48_7g00003128 [Holotrichia oblita]
MRNLERDKQQICSPLDTQNKICYCLYIIFFKGDSMDVEALEAESTVLYHIYQSALSAHDSIKDYLSSLKNFIKSPEFILHPFQLTVLLSLSTVSFCEEKVFDLIRQSIARSFREDIKKSECLWLRDLVPETLDLEDTLTKIIHNSLNERDLVIQGLVNLGFVLLGVGALLGRESLIAKKQWNLGKFVLLNLNIVFFRSTESRQVAVRGFLKLLTKLKIQNLTALSQLNSSSSSSGHSVLTQISLHTRGHNSQTNVFSNEALCLEVLNILKRCYMQQADVRGKLYDGLNDAVNHNPDLSLPVLNVLWSQFLKYYNFDEDVLPPVDFSKISIIRDVDVIVQEPIGQLVCAINFLIAKVQTLEDEDINAAKFIEVMESLCRRLIKCELIHFELDDGTNLTDILPECKKKVTTLKEAMSLYECLVGYKIWSWNKSSQSHAQQIIALYQVYFRLKGFAKNASKVKQKIDKKKKDLSKTTQLTGRHVDRSQTSQQNRTTQVQSQVSEHQDQNDRQSENIRGPKSVVIKLPSTILDLKILTKFLSLLHENVNWTTTQQANLLKVKHDIHQHVMQATAFQLQQISTHKCPERNKEYYTHCKEIAKIIYPKCINRLEEFLEFDVTTATLAVECFHTILNIVCTHYNGELKSFLCVVGDQDSDNSYLTCLIPFIEKYQTLFELDENTLDDQEFKRMLEIVGSTLTLLMSQIPINVDTVKETEKTPALKIINELTVDTFIECITNTIKILLDNIDWMTNRIRSEYGVLAYAGGSGLERKKEKLANKERSISCQLCLLIALMEAFCNVKVSIGLSKSVIENVLSVYTSLNLLTKYFILRSSKVNPAFENARFERVIKLTAKKLYPAWSMFILFIEQNQMTEIENVQTKKKNSSSLKNKVLKETKSIPKVVHEIERFTKSIIQLSNKTNRNLSVHIGPGITRDFRIKDLKDIMEKNKPLDTTMQSDDDSSEHLSTIHEDVEEREENASSDEESPPSKRSKT